MIAGLLLVVFGVVARPADGNLHTYLDDHRGRGRSDGIPRLITLGPAAGPAQRRAAQDLGAFLGEIAGETFAIATVSAADRATPQIAVGFQPAVRLLHNASVLNGLGAEGFVATTTAGGSIVLSGGNSSSRGELYAVYFLLEQLGVRFLATDTTVLPKALPKTLPALHERHIPSFEYRQQFSFATNQCPSQPTFNQSMDFNLRLGNNANDATSSGSPPVFPRPFLNLERGGSGGLFAIPPGHAHTSISLLQSAPGPFDTPTFNATKIYLANPSWFWPPGPPSSLSQLCWSNTSLQAFLIENVRYILRHQPDATLISVSQEDNGNYCRTKEELALIEAEGTLGGALFHAVNNIAAAVADEFPHVSVITLAYWWSFPAPRKLKMHPNVIVRASTIHADFALPLDDPAALANDPRKPPDPGRPPADCQPLCTDGWPSTALGLANWSTVARKTYVWDYAVNFQQFLGPYPSWAALGSNMRFYHEHNVKGFYREGDAWGPGAELVELQDYLASKLMFNVSRNETQLIEEFCAAYYGKAAPHIMRYMAVMAGAMHAAATNRTRPYFMSIGAVTDNPSSPYFATWLTASVALDAAAAFRSAQLAVAHDVAAAQHVQVSSMAIYWVVLARWEELWDYAASRSLVWPLTSTKEEAFGGFVEAFGLATQRYGVPPWCSVGGPCDLDKLQQQWFPPPPPRRNSLRQDV